ncbi:MAG: hypothetical protein ACRDZ3_01670 [Acidimicrobiia bacterium]
MSAADPLGRRALFSPPPEAADPPPRNPGREAEGKQALYSTTASRSLTTVVVDCSDCGARSRLGLIDFAWRHLPFWLWIPWLRHSNLMVCPACDRRTWLGVSWSA